MKQHSEPEEQISQLCHHDDCEKREKEQHHDHHQVHEGSCCHHDHHQVHEGSCCHHDHHQAHEESCHCHDHHGHDEDACGCGHDHDAPSMPLRRLIVRYLLGAIPIILGFLPFMPVPLRVIGSVLGYVWFGWDVWRDMILGFGKKKIFTEFTLMCVATVGAFAIGEYADAAVVMYLYSLGETLSGSAYARSKNNISELLHVTPDYATVLRDGKAIRVLPEEVDLKETILVVAGERVPLDGVVTEGGGFADTSSVTGESKPLALYEGVACPSGSVLRDGSVQLRVTERYENSVVAKLAQAVQEASKKKSAVEKKIARFARVFTPVAFGVAVAVTLLGWLITHDLPTWLRAGLAILVISCPCSLVLSVPLTYFAGIGAGAARGIIFRGGEILDSMCRLDAIAFDKTGTLSEAGLRFDGTELLGNMEEQEFLCLARDVLTYSPHAAAVSFCSAYPGTLSHTITQVENVSGRGLVCLADGKEALFGNAALMREHGIPLEDSRKTAIFGAWDGQLLGKLNFSSHLKKGADQTVRELHRLGIERIAVLSGDGAESVADLAKEAGIREYYASLTPSQKVERFETIRQEVISDHAKGKVAYCGDGLNDSAVIAGADVGIAMGSCGSALTVRSADVVLMDDDPRKLITAVRLARRTSRIANQNIAISLGLKLAVLMIGIGLTAWTGEGIPMGLAVVADVGAAVLAVLNALRAAKKGEV